MRRYVRREGEEGKARAQAGREQRRRAAGGAGEDEDEDEAEAWRFFPWKDWDGESEARVYIWWAGSGGEVG
jgi:hypothetical protein